MTKRGKVIITVAACLFAFGAILTIIGIMFGGYPGLEVSSSGIHTMSKTIEPYELEKTKLDDFSKADISVDYANIEVKVSDDDNYYLEYYLDGSEGKPTYAVNRDTFTFTQRENRIVFMSLGSFTWNSADQEAYLRLYIPKENALSFLSVESESGDFITKNLKTDSLDLDLDYGYCNIHDSDFDTLKIAMESGEVDIQNSRAGDFQFDGDYNEISLKEFSSDSATFDMESSEVTLDAAKLCNLSYVNEYGDFTLKLPEALENYSFDVSVEYGEILLPSDAPNGFREDSEDSQSYYKTKGKGKQMILIQSESGDVDIRTR